jgi:glycyl-tRNA synthetase beta chain
MTDKQDFLFELFTEELPPNNLQQLSQSLRENIAQNLAAQHLTYQAITSFASPRHLAVLVQQLDAKQPMQQIKRRGPAVSAAFDAQKQPTKACLGFAKSCGVEVQQLEIMKTKQGEWLVFNKDEPGKTIFALAGEIIDAALKKLPITRAMRWGEHEFAFVRPVHAVVLMFGKQVIPHKVLGIATANLTFGHRFLSPKAIKLTNPSTYVKSLHQHYVMVDFTARKTNIQQQTATLAASLPGKAIVDDDLLNEVAALVEWPVGLLATFPQRFLQVPREILISSMQKHQKCFPMQDEHGNLLPNFITISNIKSKNPKIVVQGNERVMHARLADAEFFYTIDLKHSLASRVEKLKDVIFQQQLGSVYAKTMRLMELAKWIAGLVGVDVTQAQRAAYLAKADLLTNVVYEFPELQGIMGYYYALHDQEPEEIAIAIREQYMPIAANAALPKTILGQILAIADRVDTLVGVFGIGRLPTGDKDPFALRRAALGIIRIIITNKLDINLLLLLERAKDLYQDAITNDKVITQVLDFIQDRFKYWVLEQQFSANEFAAIVSNKIHNLYDLQQRLLAVHKFSQLPQAADLAIANKRVSNLLAKEAQQLAGNILKEELLVEANEIKLAELIKTKEKNAAKLYAASQYVELLKDLAELHQPVNRFFDEVMVMVEDDDLRHNRLTLLAKLRQLFLQVADISRL